MKKIKLGDIFEIDTPKGKVYLHYIYKDKVIGDLIRVLPNFYPERPSDIEELNTSIEKFMVFFPLSFAYKKNIVSLVGYFSANNFGKPKYMKSQHFIKGEFIGWHIVDTETWQRTLVGNLTLEQRQLSPWGIWNDTLLINNLVNDWSLDNWI
jgi:hypothetical protein